MGRSGGGGGPSMTSTSGFDGMGVARDSSSGRSSVTIDYRSARLPVPQPRSVLKHKVVADEFFLVGGGRPHDRGGAIVAIHRHVARAFPSDRHTHRQIELILRA